MSMDSIILIQSELFFNIGRTDTCHLGMDGPGRGMGADKVVKVIQIAEDTTESGDNDLILWPLYGSPLK